MTPIADMVERMLSDGATAALVVLAIRAVETVASRERDASRHASRFVTLAERTPAAVRSARHRLKLKQNQEIAKANDVAIVADEQRDGGRDASRHGVTDHCNLSSLSSSVKGLIEEGSKERKKEAVTKSARGTRLDASAQISPEDFQFALNEGVLRERIPAEWAEFVDFWISTPGQRGTKLNWSATWRNRVRAITAKGGRNGQRSHPRQSNEAAVLAGLARAFGDRDGGPSGPADTEIPRGRFEFDAEPTRRG